MAYVSQDKKKQLAPGIRAVLKKYNMKGSIAVHHHSSLVVTLKSGAIDFSDGMVDHNRGTDVNVYWIDEHYTGVARKFFNELLAAMKGPDFFDHSDSQTDYFHRSHYTDISVGRWDKPYSYVGG